MYHNIQDTIIAHRGVSSIYPENTRIAFQATYDLGLRWIETDVSLLKDGTLIIFHDEKQGRTITGNKPLSELTWACFKDADIGSWKTAGQFADQRVLRIDDLLVWANEYAMSLNLEMKCHQNDPKLCAQALAHSLHNKNIQNIVVSSFNQDFMFHIRKALPHVRLAYLHNDHIPSEREITDKELNFEAVHLNHTLINSAEDVALIKNTGRHLRLWTINDPEVALKKIQFGADMIITDKPQDIKSHLEKNLIST